MVNITQHKASGEQIADGVYDLPEELHQEVVELLTFEELPDRYEIEDRAEALAEIVVNNHSDSWSAMIGGAMWLMAPLIRHLQGVGITPYFAFSRRESVEETLPDGRVRKTQVFRHLGFVQATL